MFGPRAVAGHGHAQRLQRVLGGAGALPAAGGHVDEGGELGAANRSWKFR